MIAFGFPAVNRFGLAGAAYDGARMEALRVQNLCKSYGRGARSVPALLGVDLALSEGEVLGLLGQNGAGKTTLVKILLDLVRPTAGRATVLGRPAARSAARREVGYLPEDHRLPDHHTAESALAFYGRLSGLPRAEASRRGAEWLERLGLAEARARPIRGFSKGMRQRLGLAQALLHGPRLLLLDEPTDGVDPVGRALIRDVLLERARAGVTILINSHLLGEVERIAGRAVILARGRIVREGSISALTRGDRVYRLSTALPLLEEAAGELRAVATEISGADCDWRFAIARDEDLDRVVALVSARGLGLRSLVPERSSLESVYLDAVGGGAGGAT